LVYLLCFAFIILMSLFAYFLREFIWQYPAIFMIASVPLAALAGYLFFTLYQKKFLKSDLD
jgi:hypothetical protein